MNKLLTKGQLSVLIVFGVLIIDQIIKILVKTNMFWHESIRITDWFYIYFTENNGMAFGMELFGKLFLTTFRIIAVGLIIWYLAKIIKENYKTGYIVCLSLILAGAVGNIIDSVFYGVIFNESTHIRQLFKCFFYFFIKASFVLSFLYKISNMKLVIIFKCFDLLKLRRYCVYWCF